jgi:hypothetical protein
MKGTKRLLVLGIATLSSSWAAYQSAKWSGHHSLELNRALARRSDSLRASNSALVKTQIDVNAFATWSLAVGLGSDSAATFLRRRFRPEFVPAFDAWLANAPGSRELPSGTPFQRPEYRLADLEAAYQLDGEADEAAALGERATQVSDNYVFSIVLYAMVSFLASLERPENTPRTPAYVITELLPIGMLLFAIAFMSTLPVTVGF